MITRVITAVIAITVGILVLVGYFFGDVIPAAAYVQIRLLNWAIILAGAATIVGILNLITVHADKVSRREKGGVYSALLVISLLGAFTLGAMSKLFVALGIMADFSGVMDMTMSVMMNGIIIPAEAMLMGLLTISLLYAAIRLLRRRTDVMSITFLVTAVLLLLGSATLPFGNMPILDVLARWVTQVLALGGMRGILIGVALGALTTGIRVLSGTDRPYGGN